MRWTLRRRPVTTPASNDIAAAIDTVCRDSSAVNRAALYQILVEGELFLVVAVLTGAAAATSSKLGQDAAMPVLTTTSPDGKPALVAFTSLAQLQRRMPDVPGYARVTSIEALDIVLDQELDGLVLDPAGPWAVVPREDVARIRNGEWQTV